MRLKTLEMNGFKAFADRTVIQFEPGITGVVGPNGAGKSNIVDSIRWVMGEMSAKHLRGSEMQDVIFGGCDSRPPTGMAQVFLTFDNSDGRAPAEYASYSEIQVGRRLYRSGESEYFINKTPCRLKDIIDLFLGTGVGTKAYSIVEQGMVGSIVSSKPEDRRILIEEAAGISKFKSRKEAALRKMEATKQNLARLGDILAELTRQINSLNRQAKKAERYQKINMEFKERELKLAATRHRALRGEIETLAMDFEKLKESEVSTSAELGSFETELETKRLKLSELERELEGVQEDLYRAEHTVKMCESEIGHREKEQSQLKVQNGTLADEIRELKEKTVKVDAEIEIANTAMALADLKLADSSESVSALESEVQSVRERFTEIAGEHERSKEQAASDLSRIANLNSSIEHLERRHIDVTGRIARDQSEIDAIDKRRAEITEKIKRSESEIGYSHQLKLKLEEESEAANLSLALQQNILAEAEEKASSLRNEVSSRRARLNSLCELKKNLEGFRDGVRSVLSRTDADGKKLSGVIGTVSEIVETEAEYESALGAVLGEKLQYVVVKSHEEGVDAIDYLRTAASGRSTFIPVGVRASESEHEIPSGEGVVGPMLNFVRFSTDYHQICKHLLGDVVLVSDLKKALSLWEDGNHRNTFVTRDGSVVDPSGVVTGGCSTGVEEQLIAQKRRVKELESEVENLERELVLAEGLAVKMRGCVKNIEERIEGMKSDLHLKDLHMVGEDRDLTRQKDELLRYEGERDRLTVEVAALSEELDEAVRERALAREGVSKHTEARNEALSKIANLAAEIEKLSSEKEAKETGLTLLKVELAKAEERASSISREISALIRTRAECVLGIDKRYNDISVANARQATLAREAGDLRAELDLAVRSSTRLLETQNILKQRYEADSAAMREREISIREVRRRHDEALSSFHGVELKLTEERGKMRYLSDNIRDRYHLDLASVESEYAQENLNVEEEEKLVAELKSKLDDMGSVNVDAIDEFKDLSVRHEFLVKQNADLTQSIDNLSKAIAKINRTSRQRFRTAFELVDAQFQKLFPKLFQGGQARLLLTDEENLLETGIEIVAQPPGKKLQSITLLSGGEKALTAVALIFSIFLIKPSPFCLLDEVDAPLDDANIDRFNDLIRSMTVQSQFILITHNKRTMELADLLYGVTMEERGVSKMVSVRLGAEKKQPEQAVA